MHWLGRWNHAATKVMRNALMSEADAEQRDIGSGGHLRGDTEIARISGRPGSGEMITLGDRVHDVVGARASEHS
jgi:hypothetical protein